LRALADAGDPDAARHLWRHARRLNDEGLMERAAKHLWHLGVWDGALGASAARGPTRQENNDIAWTFAGDGEGVGPQRFAVVIQGGGYIASGVISSVLPFWVLRGSLPRLSAAGSGEAAGAPSPVWDPESALSPPPCWLDDPADQDTLPILRWAIEQVGLEALSRQVMLASMSSVAEATDLKAWLRQVALATHSLIQARSSFQNGRMTLQGMFAQVTALAVRDHRAYIAHVGMGSAYRLRGDVVTALTQPHSLEQSLRSSGALLHHQAAHPDYERICVRALGSGSWQEPDLITLDLDPSDRFLLCTSGLRDALGEERLGALWRATLTPSEASARLLDAATSTANARTLACACFDVSAASVRG
jgi:serine/threonine protein phosphatase PrpC